MNSTRTAAANLSLETRRRIAAILRRQMPILEPSDDLEQRNEIDWNLGDENDQDDPANGDQ